MTHLDWTRDEVTRQVYRLRHGWGYGRRTAEEDLEYAVAAAERATEIARRHPIADTRAVPAILHRVVPERVSEREERFWGMFEDLHPHWRTITWRDPLDPFYFPVFGHLWRSARNGAQLADMVRTEVLMKFGGVYVDADVRPLRALDGFLTDGAFAGWEDARTIPNVVMGFSPGHPALLALAEYMLERLPGPTWWAGPGATTAMLGGRPDVALYEPEVFYPVSYRDPDLKVKVESITAETHPRTWLVHYYEGSWRK